MAIGIKRADGTTDVTYVGRVLETRERNYWDDSDFYAIVWDDETGHPKHVDYASTRYWTYDNYATVDADEATLAAYAAWRAARAAEGRAAAAAAEAATVRKGKLVRVVKGRKIPIGTEAVVGWIGDNRYGPGLRVGLRIGGDMVFTDASNVAVAA